MTKVIVRPMKEEDLDEADRVMRLAFGTFLGTPEALKFLDNADFVHTRYWADPPGALAAEVDGKIVGSNFALDWGSMGILGPADSPSRILGQGRSTAHTRPHYEDL
jgi:hypothetical protein